MTFFDQVYQKLFAKRESPKAAIHHGLISRSDAYTRHFESWKKSYRLTDMVEAVRKSYELKQQLLTNTPEVHLLQSEYSNGFAISYDPSIVLDEFQYFFDWLAEEVEQLGYRRTSGDVLITEKDNYIETREKHYLKPDSPKGETPIDQAYGNVLIEYILIDDKPSFVKLVANVYSDRLYKNASPFGGLAEYLFRAR